MSDASYSTAFLHLVLAGSSIWTARLYNGGISGIVTKFEWAIGSLGLFLVTSCVGVLRFGHPDLVRDLRNAYEHVLYLSTSLALPLIATELYLSHSYSWEISVLHAASGIIPVIADLIDHKSKQECLSGVIALNCGSLIYLGIVRENFWAIAAAVSYGLDYFIFKTGDFGDVPPLDLFILGFCFFNYFAYRALSF